MKSTVFNLIPFAAINSDLQINGELNWNADYLEVKYCLTGNMGQIQWPQMGNEKKRVIGLWENTCFEFFLKSKKEDSYIEINMSPSGDWNAFWFSQKGDALEEFKEVFAIEIEAKSNTLKAKLEWSKVPTIKALLQPGAKLIMGISAVLRDRDKSLSYWALEHCDSKPNFHQFKSFKQELQM